MKVPRATEEQCEDRIIDEARLLGYRVHAERAARSGKGWRTPVKGDPGFPDLVICGHGAVIVVELKRKPNKVEPAQRAWLDTLAVAGVSTTVVWVPERMQAFLDLLTALAHRPRPLSGSRLVGLA